MMINHIDEFENLIKQSEYHKTHHKDKKKEEEILSTTRYTSDANCSCFEFIQMVQKITSMALKEYNIDFSSDRFRFNVTDPQEKLDNPIITYQTISRTPKELKPIIRDSIYDDNAKLIGDIYAQKFECIVQFNIFASVYNLAEEVMSSFEKMMIQYAGYFKKMGVNDLYFDCELQDSDYTMYRQSVSVRNIRYKVFIEQIHNHLTDIIDDVTINNIINEITNVPKISKTM